MARVCQPARRARRVTFGTEGTKRGRTTGAAGVRVVVAGRSGPAGTTTNPGKGITMFSSTLKRSAATLGVVAGFLAAAVPAGAAGPAGASPAPANGGLTTVAPPTQGIIMHDGGVCDPIRHMGC
jgi:hypothetical protein